MAFNIKPKNTQDIENLLRMYLASAAVATAIELGLFQQLAKKPLEIEEISHIFDIPYDRCRAWLAILSELGLLNQEETRYIPSSITKNAILDVYSPETWAFIAQESSEGYQTIINLASTISHSNSVWEAQQIKPLDYITKMSENPRRAERFTTMLYELHGTLAEYLVDLLDMTNVERMMDLGGGSGVITLALLKQYENLEAVVVDIANVCNSGRKIADLTQMASRISYYPANFIQDDLPSGFDMILECDVGVYQKDLFKKLLNSLNDGGSLIIISNTNEQGAWITYVEQKPSIFWFLNTFLSSLDDPKFKYCSVKDIKALLIQVGFQKVKTKVYNDGIVIIQATK